MQNSKTFKKEKDSPYSQKKKNGLYPTRKPCAGQRLPGKSPAAIMAASRCRMAGKGLRYTVMGR